MTLEDFAYIRRCVADGLVGSPCLELGVGNGEWTCKDVIRSAGIEYVGTDTFESPETDIVIDFQGPPETVRAAAKRTFRTVICFNVLEHCFEPIRVLDNILGLLEPHGTCIIVAPTIWPLHDFPRDCYRMNPNFYEEYAARRQVRLLQKMFDYLNVGPVSQFCEKGQYAYPPATSSQWKGLWSRCVHRVLNTTGRGHVTPNYLAIGCVIEKSP